MSYYKKSQHAAERVVFTIRQAESVGSETDSVIKRSFPAGRTTALPMEYVRRYNYGRLAVKNQIDAFYPRFYLNTNLLAEIRHCNEKM